jgi:hypothetical protein
MQRETKSKPKTFKRRKVVRSGEHLHLNRLRLRLQHCLCCAREGLDLQENGEHCFLGAFPMFAPSLSWQNDSILTLKRTKTFQRVRSHTGLPLNGAVLRLLVRKCWQQQIEMHMGRIVKTIPCKRTVLFFECFRYVCPEPVLVNSSV